MLPGQTCKPYLPSPDSVDFPNTCSWPCSIIFVSTECAPPRVAYRRLRCTQRTKVSQPQSIPHRLCLPCTGPSIFRFSLHGKKSSVLAPPLCKVTCMIDRIACVCHPRIVGLSTGLERAAQTGTPTLAVHTRMVCFFAVDRLGRKETPSITTTAMRGKKKSKSDRLLGPSITTGLPPRKACSL